jgi:hypothetical protein
MVAARLAILGVVCGLLSACGGEPSGRPPALSADRSAAVSFVYTTTAGEELSSSTTRGRATAVLFVTTFDLASQIMARRLDGVLRSHKPRANGAAIVLEAPKYSVMADAFRSTLQLSYPVAMADEWGSQEPGPFGLVDRVPTLIILDSAGQETFRRFGVVTEPDIDQALAAAQQRGFAPPP